MKYQAIKILPAQRVNVPLLTSKETEHSGAYEVWLPTSYWHEHQKEANHIIRNWFYVFPDENRVSLG